MVQAILSGSKSQTRRIIKPQPHEEEHLEVGSYTPALIDKNGEMYPADYEVFGAYTEDGELTWKCPYGQVGDRLWVRETWQYGDTVRPSIPDKIIYKADAKWSGVWEPSIHMFRRYSRITLEITEVRVEMFNVATMTAYELTLEGGEPALKLLTELYDGKWVWVISFKVVE